MIQRRDGPLAWLISTTWLPFSSHCPSHCWRLVSTDYWRCYRLLPAGTCLVKSLSACHLGLRCSCPQYPTQSIPNSEKSSGVPLPTWYCKLCWTPLSSVIVSLLVSGTVKILDELSKTDVGFLLILKVFIWIPINGYRYSYGLLIYRQDHPKTLV